MSRLAMSTAFFQCCIGFHGPQVAERVVDDLAEVWIGLGDLLAARILCGLGRRLRGDGVGLLRGVGSKAARDGFLDRLRATSARRSRSSTARASCGRSSGRLAMSRPMRALSTTSPQGASGGAWVRWPVRRAAWFPVYGVVPASSAYPRHPSAYRSVLTVGDFSSHSSGAM